VSAQQQNEPGPLNPHHMVDKLQQAGTQAAARATDVANDARTRAASLADDAKEKIVGEVRHQKQGIADQISGIADTMRHSSEELSGRQDWLARLVEAGGKELGSLADTLRTNDFRALAMKLGDLARAQPAIFVGATMAAGFAAARLGKVAVADTSQTRTPEAPREPN
jgi:hypothetical protein